jgi:dCMP deaminase
MAISPDDRRFLLRCEEVKNESHDPHRKVGVVIVNPPAEVVAEGTNAPPRRLNIRPDESEAAISQDPAWKYFMLEHAERNAIFSARDRGISLVGTTMYGTLFPCADCARAIAAAGISRLVVSTADSDPVRDERWRDHYLYARTILEMGGVTVELVHSVDSDGM